MAEAVPSFHHLDAAAPHQFVWGKVLNFAAFEYDRTFGDITTLGMQQIGDRFKRRGLSCAVGAKQGHDAARRNVEGNSLEHKDNVIVDHLDIIHREDDLAFRGRRRTLLDGGHRPITPNRGSLSPRRREAGLSTHQVTMTCHTLQCAWASRRSFRRIPWPLPQALAAPCPSWAGSNRRSLPTLRRPTAACKRARGHCDRCSSRPRLALQSQTGRALSNAPR